MNNYPPISGEIKTHADELDASGSPLSSEELTIKVLSGLGPEYKEISAAIRARDTPISFEELYDKLLGHEVFLKHEDAKKEQLIITAQLNQRNSTNLGSRSRNNYNTNHKSFPMNGQPNINNQYRQQNENPSRRSNNHCIQCQLCDKFGHIAKVCRSRSHSAVEMQANFDALTNTPNSRWVINSGASHHMTNDP